jgi:hypothetical protein
MSTRRLTTYYPLILIVFLGLVLSLMPSSPVLGDNIGACQGTTTTAKVSFGGRVITPTLILRASENNANPTCAANETSLSLVALSHTIIVSPNGTPTQNGTTLLTAMTRLASANPSAANPYLLKLEPGNYDLLSQSLTLLSYVDLEGSGEDTTVISSTISSSGPVPSAATLVAASNSEVRFLKILNSGSGPNQTAVLIPGNATNIHLIHLTAITSGSGTASFGLSSTGGPLILQDSTISAAGAPSNNIGLYNNNGTVRVQNSSISAAGSGVSTNYSVANINLSAITVQNSSLSASGGSLSAGFLSGGGTSLVANSILSGSVATASYGLQNAGGTVQVANSQLSGTTAASSGLTQCPASINGNTFVLLSTSCV